MAMMHFRSGPFWRRRTLNANLPPEAGRLAVGQELNVALVPLTLGGQAADQWQLFVTGTIAADVPVLRVGKLRRQADAWLLQDPDAPGSATWRSQGDASWLSVGRHPAALVGAASLLLLPTLSFAASRWLSLGEDVSGAPLQLAYATTDGQSLEWRTTPDPNRAPIAVVVETTWGWARYVTSASSRTRRETP